jgi:hypothetical protein
VVSDAGKRGIRKYAEQAQRSGEDAQRDDHIDASRLPPRGVSCFTPLKLPKSVFINKIVVDQK